MPAKVFLTRVMPKEAPASVVNKIGKLFDAAGFSEIIDENDLVGIKIHFGEKDNVGHINPEFVRPVVDRIIQSGGKPFLTDTSTLYVGQRTNAVDHCMIAHEHGFTIEKTGCPVIMSDGLIGNDYKKIEVNGKHFKQVKVASGVATMHSIVSMAHVTGHVAAGFGAGIKNLGMGFAARSGKLEQHSDVKPFVDAKTCVACGNCVKWCPTGAIAIEDKAATIDNNLCIGCGECLTVCKFNAVKFGWGTPAEKLQEKIAEYACGAIKEKSGKIGFINFMTNITNHCDCIAKGQEPAIEDIGIMASKDVVALDRATLDIIRQTHGAALMSEMWPEIDHEIQINHARAMGLGTTEYELTEI